MWRLMTMCNNTEFEKLAPKQQAEYITALKEEIANADVDIGKISHKEQTICAVANLMAKVVNHPTETDETGWLINTLECCEQMALGRVLDVRGSK